MLIKENILGDNIGYIALEDWMGGQAAIVDRARKCYQSQHKSSEEGNARLLKRLTGSKPLHGTTLRGTVFTFDVVAPLFVIRQWTRHLVGHDYWGGDTWYCGTDTLDEGGAFDEQSFRYTDKIQFYIPGEYDDFQRMLYENVCRAQLEHYEDLREAGFPKELARNALGNSVYAQMEYTANLQALLDWMEKRLPGGGAQTATAKYAVAVKEILEFHVPDVIAIFDESRNSNL